MQLVVRIFGGDRELDQEIPVEISTLHVAELGAPPWTYSSNVCGLRGRVVHCQGWRRSSLGRPLRKDHPGEGGAARALDAKLGPFRRAEHRRDGPAARFRRDRAPQSTGPRAPGDRSSPSRPGKARCVPGSDPGARMIPHVSGDRSGSSPNHAWATGRPCSSRTIPRTVRAIHSGRGSFARRLGLGFLFSARVALTQPGGETSRIWLLPVPTWPLRRPKAAAAEDRPSGDLELGQTMRSATTSSARAAAAVAAVPETCACVNCIASRTVASAQTVGRHA